jgi:hypothetical protein
MSMSIFHVKCSCPFFLLNVHVHSAIHFNGLGHGKRTWKTDMENGHGKWTWKTDMENGHGKRTDMGTVMGTVMGTNTITGTYADVDKDTDVDMDTETDTRRGQTCTVPKSRDAHHRN